MQNSSPTAPPRAVCWNTPVQSKTHSVCGRVGSPPSAAAVNLSDLILAEGNSVHKWTPAPNEIYTTEVKIDRRGIEVSNNESAQRTVVNNTEFSGYYNEEKIFTQNKDETVTKKTTVDGELTVGKTKFVPMPTASEGLNIVILD